MSHVEQLERETEQTRLQISDTLDELKESVTPAHVLHQLADRMSDGAPVAFARNLKDQAVSNPLPVALISAGLAWLMLTQRNSGGAFTRRSGENVRSAGDAAREGVMETADAARGTADSVVGSMQETAGSATDAVSGAAESMSDSVQRTVSSGYEATADTARRTADTISESARNVGQRTRQSSDALLDFCREQPMVVAGLGLAIGAMVGALLPRSETENQLMGEASDRAKERAQNFASEKYEDAKDIGKRAFDTAKDEAAKKASEHEESGRSEEGKEGHVTLAPSDHPPEDEGRGYPWSADNSPV
jgi:uncharacterized protein YjbJ (UPF0337 family)